MKKVDDLFSLGDNQITEDKVIAYINASKKRNLSSGLIAAQRCAIEKLYVSNRKTLDWKYIGQFTPKSKFKYKDDKCSIEQIRNMLNFTEDITLKVLIYVLFTTGMRIDGLLTLKLKHLEYLPQYSIFEFTVYEGDSEEYLTYCTSECAKVIQQYLQIRKNARENCKSLEEFVGTNPAPKLSPDAPFIRTDFDATHFDKDTYKTTVLKNKARVPESLRGSFTKVLRQAGIRTAVENNLEGDAKRYYRYKQKNVPRIPQSFQ